MDLNLWNNYQEIVTMRKSSEHRYETEEVCDEDRLVKIFSHAMSDKDELEIRIAIRKVFQYKCKSIPQVQLVNAVLKELKV